MMMMNKDDTKRYQPMRLCKCVKDQNSINTIKKHSIIVDEIKQKWLQQGVCNSKYVWVHDDVMTDDNKKNQIVTCLYFQGDKNKHPYYSFLKRIFDKRYGVVYHYYQNGFANTVINEIRNILEQDRKFNDYDQPFFIIMIRRQNTCNQIVESACIGTYPFFYTCKVYINKNVYIIIICNK